MMWSWYLASDMQFYTIAPVILFIAYWYELMIQHNPSMELSRKFLCFILSLWLEYFFLLLLLVTNEQLLSAT